MWIIADRMEKYHPQLIIPSGQINISRVRLLTKESRLSAETLYVREEKNGDVSCTCGPDRMILSGAHISDVFNELLNVFDHYEKWELELTKALADAETMKVLFLCSAGYISNYLVFADPAFYMREMAGDERIPETNKYASEAIRRRMLPMNVLLRLNKDRKIRLPSPKSYIYELPEIHSNPVMTNLFVNDIHRGWLVSWNTDNKYTQGTLDLQDILADYICRWINIKETELKGSSGTQLLHDILEGKVDEERLDALMTVSGWKKTDNKILFVIRHQEIRDIPLYAVERYLLSMEYPAFLIEKGSTLIYLINTTKEPLVNVEQRLSRFFATHKCIAGESPEFSDLRQLATFYQSALIAQDYYEYLNDPIVPIVRFEQIMLPYALNLIRKNAVLPVLHPALDILKEYDVRHGTDLYETLYTFLKCNQNATEAARDLFIHRSSLIYRLDRIAELTGIDLSEFQTLVHLEISFLICKWDHTDTT